MSQKTILGFVIIKTDQVIEEECRNIVQRIDTKNNIELLFSKFSLYNNIVSKESFVKSACKIGPCVDSFVKDPTIVGLGCTSMSFTLGSHKVNSELSKDSLIKATDMARAQIEGLISLNAQKICLLTLYTEVLSQMNASFIEKAGISVVKRHTLNILKDVDTSAITPEKITEMVQEIDCDEADAIVIGCSAFRTCGHGFIDNLEKLVQKPIVTSTQSFCWLMLRSAGITQRINGYGKLFSHC